jgi:hypothetical protein
MRAFNCRVLRLIAINEVIVIDGRQPIADDAIAVCIFEVIILDARS